MPLLVLRKQNGRHLNTVATLASRFQESVFATQYFGTGSHFARDCPQITFAQPAVACNTGTPRGLFSTVGMAGRLRGCP